MIDLLILIYFTVQIGRLAKTNGEPALKWRVILVCTWVFAEIIGFYLSTEIRGGFRLDDVQIPMMVAFGFALTGYYIVKRALMDTINKNSDDLLDT